MPEVQLIDDPILILNQLHRGLDATDHETVGDLTGAHDVRRAAVWAPDVIQLDLRTRERAG
jgi:hypothetical protein